MTSHSSTSRSRTSRSATARRRRIRGEKGYVLIMTALLLVPLIVFTAFGVDLGWNRLAHSATLLVSERLSATHAGACSGVPRRKS